jgi:hypothetical protein
MESWPEEYPMSIALAMKNVGTLNVHLLRQVDDGLKAALQLR